MESKYSISHFKPQIGFIYDNDFGRFIYEELHFMQPDRVRMTFELAIGYGLFDKMTILRPMPASAKVMSQYHDADYIEFLEALNTSNYNDHREEAKKYNIGDKDCPLFGGLYNYCQLSVGGSILAAAQLNQRRFDIAINWMGGLHHAKKGGASGFCYINDIVLGIMELLKFHQRVLYIDTDVHHGDGVEEAFAATNRVMTVSFHKFGTFFPHSGHIGDIGIGEGKGYSVNIPLHEGITDLSYQMVFKPIMYKIMEFYDPHVVVLQCGADSLCGDRLGPFNMTLRGHGECLNYMKSFNVPLMVLGGGGYTPENVARCWTYETAIACDVELGEQLPHSRCNPLFGKQRQLHIEAADKIDMNSREYISLIQQMVFQNLDNLDFVPSVQMLQNFEREFKLPNEIPASESANPDQRLPTEVMDIVVKDEGEYYDQENDSGSIRDVHDCKQEMKLEQEMKIEIIDADEEKYQLDYHQDVLVEPEILILERYERMKEEEFEEKIIIDEDEEEEEVKIEEDEEEVRIEDGEENVKIEDDEENVKIENDEEKVKIENVEQKVKIEDDENVRIPVTIEVKPEAKVEEEENEMQQPSDEEKENIAPTEQIVKQEVPISEIMKQESKIELHNDHDEINIIETYPRSDQDSGYGSPEAFKAREDELNNDE